MNSLIKKIKNIRSKKSSSTRIVNASKPRTINLASTLLRRELPVKPKLSRHCIATLVLVDQAKLFDSKGFEEEMLRILERESVQCIGEVTHNFSNDSFTSIFGLAESHISVHTWPERFTVQLDVFLCNYMNDNTDKCERIFESVIEYFGPASDVERTRIERL